MEHGLEQETFCFVSCDIVGYGLVDDLPAQQQRIEALNHIVREALNGGEHAIWASGGDGGHVAFSMADGNGAAKAAAGRALELMKRLFGWARTGCVSLRITGHVGSALRLCGADGRTQLVGDGINVCGSVVDFGDPSAIVVTNPFRELLGSEGVDGVQFKGERTVYLKHFAPERLFLVDIPGAVESRWGAPTKSEHHLLSEAQKKRLPWQTIYHAKRLLQSNTADVAARDALEYVATEMADTLVAHDREGGVAVNLFLSEMDPTSFFEFLLNTELVERKNGERLCQADEDGDTMFIVLMGEIGVVVTSDADIPINGAPREAPLDVTFLPGSMVGELAFALRRSRTAALQAIGLTAVLAFNYRKLEAVLSRNGIGADDIRRDSMRYFQDRCLEYLCNHAPYLIGPDKTGPLSEVRHPWRWMRGRRAEIYQIDGSKHQTISADDPLFRGADGLYALAGGRLERHEYLASGDGQEARANDAHLVDGRRPQLLWVDMPGTFVHTLHKFRVRSEHAVIIRISFTAFQNMKVVEDVIPALKRALLRHYRYDVFLAYDKRNHSTAVTWAKALRNRGLSVYMNNPVAGVQFKREIVAAMLSSAVLVPLITSDVAPDKSHKRGKAREDSKTWVHTEVELRRALFPGDNCNILPIQHPGANVASVTDGIGSVVVVHESKLSEAINEAVNFIKGMKSRDPIPFSTHRTSVPKSFI